MKKIISALFIALLALSSTSSFAYITTNPNDPNVKAACRDGTYSTSTGKGTCSRHGGVKEYIKKP